MRLLICGCVAAACALGWIVTAVRAADRRIDQLIQQHDDSPPDDARRRAAGERGD